MRFRRLRVAGFKSFVEPAELLIEPGLTGVVGPNGCGKSNLLEAIRWVMGEGSARALRGGGMEDVIFAGTARRPARTFAEVSLLVEQEGQEREVVRRIERGAGSAYRIDGRDVRARDVALLFADASTGAHSPALVSQGRVAAVIAAKPTERRQMLEEAAGIAGLHVRRREAEGKLRQTEDNLTRLTEMLGEADARAGALRRQARAAERYRQLSAEIRVADARALFARWREAAAAAERLRLEAVRADESVMQAAEAQRAAAAHASEAVTALAGARRAAERARIDAGATAQALDRLHRERTSVHRRLADLAQQRETLVRDRAREEQLTGQADAALSRLADEEVTLEQALAEQALALPGIEEKRAAAEAALRAAEDAAALSQARIAAEDADLRVARHAVDQARGRVARARGDLDRVIREIAALEDAEPLREALAAVRSARAAGEAAAAAANEKIAAAERQRELASRELDATGSAGAAARALLASTESEERALAAALTKVAGDRLLDRLAVTSGYERALAAALGDDLEAPLGGGGATGWEVGHARGGADACDASTMAAYVSGAGGALDRRLAQVIVLGEDDGRELAIGQRLVTRAGALRRWDGYFARGSGAAAAERLIRINRLGELRALLPAQRESADAARSREADARASGERARRLADAARADASTAEARIRQARRDEDQLLGRIERREAQLTVLEERRSRAMLEHGEAAAVEAAAATALASLPDPQAGHDALARAQIEARQVRAQLTAISAKRQSVAQGQERDARRLQAVRAEISGWRARATDAADRQAGFAARAAAIEAAHADLAARPARLVAEIAEAEAQAQAQGATVRRTATEEAASTEAVRVAEEKAAAAGAKLSDLRETRAGAVARAEAAETRRAEISQLAGERYHCPAATLPTTIAFEAASVGDAAEEAARHDRLHADRERLGAVNLVAERELAELEEARATNMTERDELAEAVNRLRGQIGALNREGRQRLRAAFEAVDGHFRRLFATLFAGGEAHLSLIDADDPLEAGLEIMAQPPGKRLGSLTLLSGGEQALTAVALVFALFLTSPAPICVLDEVDAPLDDANIDRFCNMLDAMIGETDTRYLVVTHNPVTMARMHRLFGVTMVEQGVSRLVSVDLGGATHLLAAE